MTRAIGFATFTSTAGEFGLFCHLLGGMNLDEDFLELAWRGSLSLAEINAAAMSLLSSLGIAI